MTKAKRAGILGAMILVGLTFVTLRAAGQNPPLLITDILGALKQTCPNSTDPAGCQVVARLIQPFIAAQFDQFVPKEIQKVLGIPSGSTCDECISALQSFETQLALNGTVQNIQETMHEACVKNFPDPTLEQLCESQINQYAPNVVDSLLADFPPLIACRAKPLNLCPP